MQTFIGVKTSFRGTHCWPTATSVTGSDEIKFLEQTHRHTFFVEVEIQVSHHDRDLEFFLVQREVDKVIHENYKDDYDGLVYNLGHKSCEMICSDIYYSLLHVYRAKGIDLEKKQVTIKVSEDNEVYGKILFGATDGN